MAAQWTESQANEVYALAKSGVSIEEIERVTGRSRNAVDKLFFAKGWGRLASYVPGARAGSRGPSAAARAACEGGRPVVSGAEIAAKANAAIFEEIVRLARKHDRRGGLSLETLSNELDMSPMRARDLVTMAREAGYTIETLKETLHFKAPEPVQTYSSVAPAVKGRSHRAGVFTDVHAGSKYFMAKEFTGFVQDCMDDGITDFFSSGDLLEGCYYHAKWELNRHTQEEQAGEFLDHFPYKKGNRLWFIDGNHDHTWTATNGVESGRLMARLARERGRDDIIFLGSRGALLQYGDTRVELWHQNKGLGYALSYKLQNKIRDTNPSRRPNFLIAGHVHQYVKFQQGGVWAWYAGTFQHGDSAFGKSLGGDVAIGGMRLGWSTDGNGKVTAIDDKFFPVDYGAPVFQAVAV